MNNWNFTGNLGHAAELRYTQSGEPVVNFNVAVKSGYGDKALTTWVKCNLWGKRAESLAKYLTKGQQVAVSGEACNRKWSKQDGSEGLSLEVRVNEIDLIGKRQDGTGTAADEPGSHKEPSSSAAPSGKPSFDDLGDDIPF